MSDRNSILEEVVQRLQYEDMRTSANIVLAMKDAIPTQGADAQFIAEHGHRLAELLKLDYYDIADRDAQITMLLANKLPQPSQGADARPVAIYQTRWEHPSNVWGDVDKEVFDNFTHYHYFARRIVYATRDAEAKDSNRARGAPLPLHEIAYALHVASGRTKSIVACHEIVNSALATHDAAPSDAQDAEGKMAMEVFGGINALRWILNITTEFDRKDVRTRQAARLLDDYFDKLGVTNREHLERLWKALNDKLPQAEVRAYLRALDSADTLSLQGRRHD